MCNGNLRSLHAPASGCVGYGRPCLAIVGKERSADVAESVVNNRNRRDTLALQGLLATSWKICFRGIHKRC